MKTIFLAMNVPGIQTARTPIWIQHFVAHCFLFALIVGLNVGLPLPGWGLGLALGVEALLSSLGLFFAVSRRTSRLVAIAQRQPIDLEGTEDVAWLRKFPWYGCSEIDHTQLALLELLFHHVIQPPAQVGTPMRHSKIQQHWGSANSLHEGLESPLIEGRPDERDSAKEFESCIGSYSDDVKSPIDSLRRAPSNGAINSCFDPLNDNAVSWAIATTGAKDPGGPILFQLLKSIKIGQSLSSVTLPVYILEARSLLEKLSDQFVHADLLMAYDASADPYEQLLLVAKWWLAAYHIRPDGPKKPYNPVLGEAFCCAFDHGTSKTVYFAEQVCHHPPVTALYAKGSNFVYQAIYHPMSRLVSLNCAASIGEGEAVLTIGSEQRKYVFTWPSAYVSGFVAGTARLELGGKVIITDQTTRVSLDVEFKRKPMLGGQYDRIEASTRSPAAAAGPSRLSGVWHDTIFRQDFDGPQAVFLKATELPMPRPTAINIDNYEWQSRSVWKEVTKAIRQENAELAAKGKHSIEEHQRALRKQLAERGEIHTTRFFSFALGAESLHLHAKGSGGSGKGKEALWALSNWTFNAPDFVDRALTS